MLSIALAILFLPRSISAALAATAENEASPAAPLLHHCSSSSYGRCSNWNPFQCRITEIITHTVVQHYTSTVYVGVETGTVQPTFTILEAEVQTAYTNAPNEHSISSTACESVMKGPHTYETLLGASTSTFPEVTTHEHRTLVDEVVPIWVAHPPQEEHSTAIISIWEKKHNGHGDKARPTGRVSIWEEAGMMAEPSVSIENPYHELKHLSVGSDYLSWNSRPKCLKRLQYTYTATFDDLHVPHIPKPYNGLIFSDHFSVFEPSLVYGNYTAPSPPFAVQSYPSRSASIRSLTPFNLISMYVGCEYAQTCLIRIRGWSPSRTRPTAEMQIRVTHDTSNWAVVKFFNFGFNLITLLEFNVLDLNTGTTGTLGLTLDQIRFNKEVVEVQDCFE
ncbi:hypothetical protein EV426DRAFT_573789 [Tirmania nivea]|nr:hypothetical protein EV426DRAFT_573789 [Tirmania nivea]